MGFEQLESLNIFDDGDAFDGVDGFLDDDGDMGGLGMSDPPALNTSITPDRTGNFGLKTGQFRAPETGAFEPGGPPPDYDPTADRFRAKSGEFKDRPADHFDEPAEVRLDSLEPRG